MQIDFLEEASRWKNKTKTRGCNVGTFAAIFLDFFNYLFCYDVAICDLVYDIKTISHSGN